MTVLTKNKKLIPIIAALAIALFIFPKTSFAEKIIFASPEDLPPKIFQENSKLRGTYVDIIREICKRMKVEPVFEQYPWARAVTKVKNGTVDAIFPPFKTDERLEFLYFPSEPMSHTRNVIFALKKRHIKVKKLEDLKGLIVGVNNEYSYGDAFDDYKKNLTLEYSRTEEMQINKLAHAGKVRMDVVAASEEAFKFISKKLGKSKDFEVVYVISETPAYVAFSKAGGERTKKLADRFDKVLIQMKRDGVVARISDGYLK